MKKEKKSKYDTNPLDADYAKRADDDWGATRSIAPEPEVKEHWPAEAPTKRYDNSIPVSYPSVYVPPSYPPRPVETNTEAATQTTAPTAGRTVPGLGLPENVTFALPYAPFFIGAVAGAIELCVTPRTETQARFHASQGLALQLITLLITLIFNFVSSVSGNSIGGILFWAAATIFFILATLRVWKGEGLHVAAVDDAADWLNERIDPQKIKSKKKQ